MQKRKTGIRKRNVDNRINAGADPCVTVNMCNAHDAKRQMTHN